MEFSLSHEQKELLDRFRGNSYAYLNDELARDEAETSFDVARFRRKWRELAKSGILGLTAPERLGGGGKDLLGACAALRGFGYGCNDNSMLLAVGAQIWTVLHPILEFGSETQIDKYARRIMSGEWIGADAITEADSGSDAMNISLRAEKTEGGYILNGTKVYVGQAPLCDFAIVFAKTREDAGVWGNSAFLVDFSETAPDRGPALNKAGLRTISTGSLHFKDYQIPADALLGSEGAGHAIFTRASELERQLIFAGQIGAMERQMDECIQFARGRKNKGQPIDNYQSVSNRLADMRVRFETACLMQMRAAWQLQNGQSNAMEAAITKLHISEALLASSIDAARTFASLGYQFDASAARDTRDAIGGITLGGTSDIQRQIIAAYQGRMTGKSR